MDDVERLNAGSSFRYRFLIVALMPAPVLGQLVAQPALERPDLLAPPVHAFLSTWDRAGEVGVADIVPELADTAACAEAYDLPMQSGANCVVVSGRRAGEERLAACLVRADTRADVHVPTHDHGVLIVRIELRHPDRHGITHRRAPGTPP